MYGLLLVCTGLRGAALPRLVPRRQQDPQKWPRNAPIGSALHSHLLSFVTRAISSVLRVNVTGRSATQVGFCPLFLVQVCEYSLALSYGTAEVAPSLAGSVPNPSCCWHTPAIKHLSHGDWVHVILCALYQHGRGWRPAKGYALTLSNCQGLRR